MDDLARLTFPPKLLKYIEHVEHQTKRRTRFEYVDGFNLSGHSFGFRLDPHSLCIGVIRGNNLDDLRAERSIAHEITHGLLIYGLGYYALTAKETASDEDIQHLSLLSFIDDIVVNKIIQEQGFPVFGATYYEMLNKEIQAARCGVDIYDPSYSTLFKRRYMASRYILSWGAIQYYDLDPDDRNLLTEFLRVFQKAFPRPYMVAKDIEELILKNDIFSTVGHKHTLENILKQWNLENCCSLDCFKT